MSDLIERQSAIDALLGITAIRNTIPLDSAIFNIKKLPSAQSEIIRCKDCKHSEHWYRDKQRCFLWAEDGIDVFEDGFCNYAERRNDE